MYLFSASHGHGTSAWPLAQRHADRVQARHELAVVAEHLERASAHPRHDPHRHRDVGRVGDLDADVGDGADPSGPIEKGTTYMVRPCHRIP